MATVVDESPWLAKSKLVLGRAGISYSVKNWWEPPRYCLLQPAKRRCYVSLHVYGMSCSGTDDVDARTVSTFSAKTFANPSAVCTLSLPSIVLFYLILLERVHHSFLVLPLLSAIFVLQCWWFLSSCSLCIDFNCRIHAWRSVSVLVRRFIFAPAFWSVCDSVGNLDRTMALMVRVYVVALWLGSACRANLTMSCHRLPLVHAQTNPQERWDSSRVSKP